MKVRLECTRGTSNKFYEIELTEAPNRFTVTGYNGAIGRAPIARPIYDGDSRDEAVQYYNAKRNQKLKDGYDKVSDTNCVTEAPKTYPTSDLPIIWPMGAVGIGDANLDTFLRNDKYIGQEKLDGERSTIHFTKTGLRIFSRNAGVNDPTKPLEKTQSLPHLAALQFPTLAGTILDSEIKEKGRTAAQTSGDIHSKNGASNKVVIHAFDVLSYNGNDTTGHTLRQRLLMLNEIMPELASTPYIDFPPYAYGTEAKTALYNEVRARKGEGIMLKLLTGTYVCSAKPAGNWIKVKKKAMFDCIITGFTQGKPGKYSEQIGAIIFSQLRNGKLIEIGQTSGMSDAIRLHMTQNKAAYIGQVIEVSGQERLKSGAIRHCQFERLRTDKRPEECIYNPTEQ